MRDSTRPATDRHPIAFMPDEMEPSRIGPSEALVEVTAVTAPRFEAFFEAEHVRLARALYLLTGSAAEADELTQEAMVRVYERWDRVQRMDSPQGYLFRTALNLHRSRVRWLANRARHVHAATPSPDPADAVEQQDRLGRALAALPTGQRAAVVLVEWLGMDQREAAAALGIKPGSIRARLSRAKADLRQMLEDDDA